MVSGALINEHHSVSQLYRQSDQEWWQTTTSQSEMSPL